MIAAQSAAAPRLDPRYAAFISANGTEVFSGVVYANQIWNPDPFDVETIHREARGVRPSRESGRQLLAAAPRQKLTPTRRGGQREDTPAACFPPRGPRDRRCLFRLLADEHTDE